MAYYTIAEKESNGIYYPQFGDYDLETVEGELEYMVDSGIKRSALRIIKTSSSRQDAIDAKIEQLNKKQAEKFIQQHISVIIIK